MKKSKLFKPALFASILTVPIGALLKILHFQVAEQILMLGLMLAVVYIISALYEIYSSDRLRVSEKVMWTTTLLLFGPLSGILYLLIGRERVFREYKILKF